MPPFVGPRDMPARMEIEIQGNAPQRGNKIHGSASQDCDKFMGMHLRGVITLLGMPLRGIIKLMGMPLGRAMNPWECLSGWEKTQGNASRVRNKMHGNAPQGRNEFTGWLPGATVDFHSDAWLVVAAPM
jgi:hypothetical protein